MCYAFRWERNRLHAHNEFRQAYNGVQVYAFTGVCGCVVTYRKRFGGSRMTRLFDFHCLVSYL